MEKSAAPVAGREGECEMFLWPVLLALGLQAAVPTMWPWQRGAWWMQRAARAVAALLDRLGWSRRLYVPLCLACLCLLPALAGLWHPLAQVPFLYMALDVRALTEAAMRVRRALEENRATAAQGNALSAAAYEAAVREAAQRLAEGFAGGVMCPLLLAWLGAPIGLGAALACAYAALRVLADGGGQARLQGVLAACERRVAGLSAWCAGWVASVLGMEGIRARLAWRRDRQACARAPEAERRLYSGTARLASVMRAALGWTEPGDTRAPLAGDLTQACALLWGTALAVSVLALLVSVVGIVLLQ